MLSGVPVAVMGVDSESVVTILNRSAEELSLADPTGQATVGASVASVLPEIVPILKDAAEVFRAPFKTRSSSSAASPSAP